MEHHAFVDERLAEVPLFREFSKRELRTVSALTTIVDLEPGAVVTQEGRPGSQFVVLLDGSVAVSARDRVVNTRGAGDFLGEMSLLTGCPQTATALATTSTTVAVVSKPDFWSLLGGFAAIGDALRSAMLERFDELQQVHVARAV